MHKVSTPGDRQRIAAELPVVMTELEMALPLSWNTTVIHLFTFHTVELLEAAGPFIEQNMLDIERYHTLFKSMARGTTNIMCSIKNHYEIFEACQQNRLLEDDVEWTADPRPSTAAGLAAKPDSALKDERCVSTVGDGAPGVLPDADFLQVQALWALQYPTFADMLKQYSRYARNYKREHRGQAAVPFSQWQPRYLMLSDEQQKWRGMTGDIKVRGVGWYTMCGMVSSAMDGVPCVESHDARSTHHLTQTYDKCVYAGYSFTTPTTHKKHDDSHVCEMYRAADGQQQHAYGQIRSMFVHELYPGGPSKVVLRVHWFQNARTCPVSGNARVFKNYQNHLNVDFKFTFMETCYQQPVAVWPYDPLDKLPQGDPLKDCFDIINRKQAQAI